MDVTMILLRRYDNAELRAAVDDYFGDEDASLDVGDSGRQAVVGDRNRQLEFVNNWVDHALRKDAPWKAEWKPLTTPMESYPVTNRPTPFVEAMHREVFKLFVMKPYVIHRLHERLLEVIGLSPMNDYNKEAMLASIKLIDCRAIARDAFSVDAKGASEGTAV